MTAAEPLEPAATPLPAGPARLLEQVDIEAVENWGHIFAKSFRQAFGQIVGILPQVLAMLVVVVVGYVVARIAGRFSQAVAEAIGLERAAERSGLQASMTQVGIRRNVSWIVGQMVFWLLLCVFLTAGFNILGLETVSTAMQQIVAYIPRLLVATVVVVVGLLVAQFIRGVIATGADRLGLSYAEYLASACYGVLALMTFLAAFDQLGIKFELLRELVLIAFGALALGFGLALGLGGRDVMAGILAGYYTRQRLQAGDRVSVAGLRGTVREVGPVATVIETEESGLLNRHSVPNVRMLSEAIR